MGEAHHVQTSVPVLASLYQSTPACVWRLDDDDYRLIDDYACRSLAVVAPDLEQEEIAGRVSRDEESLWVVGDVWNASMVSHRNMRGEEGPLWSRREYGG